VFSCRSLKEIFAAHGLEEKPAPLKFCLFYGESSLVVDPLVADIVGATPSSWLLVDVC